MISRFLKRTIPFSKKLFYSVVFLFLIFASAFLSFQYYREKSFKNELLHSKLLDYNDRLYNVILEASSTDEIPELIDSYLKHYMVDSMRVTIIDAAGRVIYDNKTKNINHLDNHLERTEVKKALENNTGFDIHRTSQSTGIPYFYSAKYYNGDYIVRTALPYDVSLIQMLKADFHFIWFTLVITAVLIVLFYRFTHRLGISLSRLHEFAERAEHDEPIDTDLHTVFPHNELGEISRHIIRVYKKLQQTKQALYIEREKLIAHLHSSHEGLGIFNPDKKEILVNSHFNQYCNHISDSNLKNTEDVFAIPEFRPITEFIDRNQSSVGKTEKRMSISLYKNGKSFMVECIFFQDHSFEISITDVTQEKEQIDLKRQLTQNAAHELKTPVSSIQGYLETIVNNKELSEEKRNDFLERCYLQSNRLSRLLRDISVLTRMDEAPGMIDMEKLDIVAMIRNILIEVTLDLEQKNIHVETQLGTELLIRGNSSLIYSIFRNLIDNSIAYAGTGITITIKCFREDENHYYFSFADTGIGIAPEHLNRLFERFYRVDKGRSRKLGGTGLGLAIVKNAVNIHGGNISAKNNQGGGLEFVFTLSKA